jgi:hypothetical protein
MPRLNAADHYVIAGFGDDGRWPISQKYGCVTAGGGSWYWKPLRHLKTGSRVFAYVGGAGYVGIGRVAGPTLRFRDLEVYIAGTAEPLIDQPDVPAELVERACSDDGEITEYADPVTWIVTCSTGQAVAEPGLFASEVTVCKLRDKRTISFVSAVFGIEG